MAARVADSLRKLGRVVGLAGPLTHGGFRLFEGSRSRLGDNDDKMRKATAQGYVGAVKR